MSSKHMINIRVVTMDAELEFSIMPSTTGKQLFDQIVKTINLREIWYYGLQYMDSKGLTAWLKLNKEVLKQDVKKELVLQLKFRAKFFPEDVANEIIQDVTLRLFFLQVKEQVLSDEIYCPPEQAILLASYAMQAKYGNYEKEQHMPGSIANERLVPHRILAQYKLGKRDWECRVMNWWSDHSGLSREEAMMEYMKIAQDLDQYGVNYFEIRNKKGTELYLGVDALGLNIYDKENKLSPKVGFPWSEIRNISFNDKKFVIKPVDKKAQDFVFYTSRLRINKQILALCMGNHELYIRRRKPDSIEVQQIKLQAQKDRIQRQLEQQRLKREMNAREMAEQKQHEYEAKMSRMKEEMEKAQRDLEHAQGRINRLELQLHELNETRRELESKEKELNALNAQLKSERAMSEGERAHLIKQITLRESQVHKMRTEVSMKSAEMNKLKNEVESENPAISNATFGNGSVEKSVFDNGSLVGDEFSNTVDIELDTHNDARQPELDRVNITEQNVNFKHKLESLIKELDNARDDRAITNLDILHMDNKRQGRDRYKTLRQIRSGNTKRRIDQYENM